MKPPTVFLGEMTSPEVEAFLRDHDTVIVPTGSTEQHGPHGPLLTDVLVPTEVARRVAPRVGAVVAPDDQLLAVVPACRVHGRRAHPDPDVHGAHRGPVRRAGADRLPPDRVPQRPLRQHVCDRLRLRQRRRPAARRARALPDQLLGRHDAPTRRPSSSTRRPASTPTGARRRRSWRSTPTSSTWTRRTREMPPFPEVDERPAPVHTAFFFSSPGSVYRATQSGTWGDARESIGRVRRALPGGRDRTRRCASSTTSSAPTRRCPGAERPAAAGGRRCAAAAGAVWPVRARAAGACAAAASAASACCAGPSRRVTSRRSAAVSVRQPRTVCEPSFA